MTTVNIKKINEEFYDAFDVDYKRIKDELFDAMVGSDDATCDRIMKIINMFSIMNTQMYAQKRVIDNLTENLSSLEKKVDELKKNRA